MYFVLEGHDTAVLGRMHDKRIATIEPNVVTVSGIERYQIGTASRYPRPTRNNIEKLKQNIIGEGVGAAPILLSNSALWQVHTRLNADFSWRTSEGGELAVEKGLQIRGETAALAYAPPLFERCVRSIVGVLAEIDNLVRCRSAIQHAVAKGKPPEAANHLAMRFGIAQKTGALRMVTRQIAAQPHRFVLISYLLAMLKGYVKKDATKRRQLPIEPFCDCAPCHTQRRGIGCERARGIAKHIAWKLVEEDYECEAARGLALPLIKLTRSGRGTIASESFDA